MKMSLSPKSTSQYSKGNYDSKKRFASYWHQINEILETPSAHILEVGIGNGFVSNYLRNRKIKITTLDINYSLNPNCVSSATELPFPDGTFDVVACFEVLEHLPYQDALRALKEFRRVSRKKVLFSVPDRSYAFAFTLVAPRLGRRSILISFKRWPPLTNPLLKQEHCWEIGVRGYTLEKIKADLVQSGLELVNTYRVLENPSHRFFRLRIQKTPLTKPL